ncbi:hypothetical protein Tco_0587468 [Tanacetum coccineum]
MSRQNLRTLIPSVFTSSKVLHHRGSRVLKFSCRITPLITSMLEDAQGTPTSSAAHSHVLASSNKVLHPSMVQLHHHDSDSVQTQADKPFSAKQIIKLKAKLKKLSKFVQPVVKHHAFWVESQNLKKKRKKQKKQKKHKKTVSSVKMGRNKDEGTLSEEHYVQEEDTADPFFDNIADKDCY